ncbi:MAG: cupin domain-containing protein [Deltaproteobacteria bacterium]|nr:cupin domain-containing protein [Deltaproteobacteria bacterium]MBW2121224.1 cupin domain-containing protein [Deltaproteobacteria bacterium]
MVEEQIVRIGQRIKHLRKEMGLSIREAARLTGTSPATIQKIESNGMVPSIAILMRIAQGLRKNVSFFLGEDGESKEVVLVPRDGRNVAYVPASRLKVEDLGSDILDAKLEATLLTIEQGGRSGKDPLIHAGEEVKYCLEGRIAYYIDGNEYLLGPGDCIHFKSDKPHFWKNVGQGRAKILSICTPPPFRRLTR